jgi:hypothetical protein
VNVYIPNATAAEFLRADEGHDFVVKCDLCRLARKSIENGTLTVNRLVRQTHDKCQSDIQAQNVLAVEMTHLSSNPLPTNGDGLIGLHLRSNS